MSEENLRLAIDEWAAIWRLERRLLPGSGKGEGSARMQAMLWSMKFLNGRLRPRWLVGFWRQEREKALKRMRVR